MKANTLMFGGIITLSQKESRIKRIIGFRGLCEHRLIITYSTKKSCVIIVCSKMAEMLSCGFYYFFHDYLILSHHAHIMLTFLSHFCIAKNR